MPGRQERACLLFTLGRSTDSRVLQALSEAYRVLRPGGRFLCLEFSHVPNPLIRWYVRVLDVMLPTDAIYYRCIIKIDKLTSLNSLMWNSMIQFYHATY